MSKTLRACGTGTVPTAGAGEAGNNQAKYYMTFFGAGPSLAVEKHLYGFIKDNFANCTVMSDAIEDIVDDIKDAQAEYFQTHRGKEVDIRSFVTPAFSSIAVGSMCITLTRIKNEYYKG